MDQPAVISELDVSLYPAGTRYPLLLDLVENAAGLPTRIPILLARGRKPGPFMGMMAAVHGNEINGIPVLHRLFDWLTDRPLSGTIAAVLITNVPGFHMHQREFLDGQDLNKIMPGKPDGSVSEVYAFRLLDKLVSSFDYLLDLHTASFGRINSLYARVDAGDPLALKMARLLRPQIILENEPGDGTVRGAASHLGIPSVTFEIGNPQRFQRDYIRDSVAGIRRVLEALGMVAKTKPSKKPPREPVVCRRSEWLYADRGGLLVVHPHLTDIVERGESIAVLRDIYGTIVREYRAPYRGIVIGKSVNPVGGTGARILHLGEIKEP